MENLFEMAEINLRKIIAQRLRAARIEQGLSQVELAKRSGIAYATIGRIEREESFPDSETAKKLASVLGIDSLSISEPTKPTGLTLSPEREGAVLSEDSIAAIVKTLIQNSPKNEDESMLLQVFRLRLDSVGKLLLLFLIAPDESRDLYRSRVQSQLQKALEPAQIQALQSVRVLIQGGR